MRQILIFLLLIFGFLRMDAQLVVTSLMGSAGNHYSQDGFEIEWAVGELFTNSNTNQAVAISEGLLQHSLFSAIPDILFLSGFVSSGVDTCFAALKTIIATDFIAHNGISVRLIAGENIVLLPGFVVQEGAILHAFISSDYNYCNQPSGMLSDYSNFNESYELKDIGLTSGYFNTMKIYPNPTSGIFTVEIGKMMAELSIELYSVLGERILSQRILNQEIINFDLSLQPAGIYFIRFTNGQQIWLEKIIKY